MAYKILSFDGGGIRGIYPAYMLSRAKNDRIIKDIRKQVDMFVGTSTGSIIAGALACGIDEDTIYRFYHEKGNDVFDETFRSEATFGILTPKYSKKKLRAILDEMLGNTRMNELEDTLLITATDVTTGKAVIFRNTSDIRVVDAIMASISAPYFFSYEDINHINFADGGLWASNPAIVGYIEAKYKIGIPEKDIQVLSFGTGERIHPRFLTGNTLKYQELPELIDLFLTLQSRHLNSLAKIIINENYYRLNIRVSWLAIDKVGVEFLSKMKKSYYIERNKIISFFKN